MLSLMKNFVNAFDLLARPSCSVSVLFHTSGKKKSPRVDRTQRMEDFWIQPPPLSTVPSSLSDPTGSCRGSCRHSLCGDEQTASAPASRLPGWERAHLVVQLKSCPDWTAVKTPFWKKIKDKNQTTRVWERRLGRSAR